jgi:hypothetical protein
MQSTHATQRSVRRLVLSSSPLIAAIAFTTAPVAAQNVYFGSNGFDFNGQASPLAIYSTDLNGQGLSNILSSPSYTSGMDVDGVRRLVFWKDHITGNRSSIVSASLSGGPQTVVASWDNSGSSNNYGMALDTLNQRVYWADQDGVKRSNYDGSGLAPVAATPGAWSVEVDPAAGKIFWTAPFGGNAMRVWMANLDGSSAQAVVTLPETRPGPLLSGITVDPGTQTVYWSDYDAGTVSAVPYAGGIPTVILSGYVEAAGLDYEPTTNRLYVVSKASRVDWMDPAGGPLTNVFTGTLGLTAGETWDIAVIVPSPGAATLLALGGVIAARRRR